MTRSTLRSSLLALLVLAAANLFALGCEPLGDYCDPSLRDDCICEDDFGDACDPEADADASDSECLCYYPDDDDGFAGDDGFDDDFGDDGGSTWRFVLIEDLTQQVSGEAPGADIDAISITTLDGVEHFATSVEDFNIAGANNAFANPSEALGAPDSNCERDNFVALGGLDQDGYITVGFSTTNDDLTFGSGARVTVYELGPTSCADQPSWDDDPFSVSVSVSSDRDTFTEVGTGGPGRRMVVLP